MTATPGAAPRSAALTLGQAILALQALGVLFAAAYLAGVSHSRDGAAGMAWGIGLAVAFALVVATGAQNRPWGRALGWILQAPMIAAGVVSLPVAVVGIGFLALWVAALRIGGRIDRERAAFLSRGAMLEHAPSDHQAPSEGGAR